MFGGIGHFLLPYGLVRLEAKRGSSWKRAANQGCWRSKLPVRYCPGIPLFNFAYFTGFYILRIRAITSDTLAGS
jgi:hypothetical protein